MGWEVEGRLKRAGTYVYLWLIHVDAWQKPTQYCKAIILQLNKYIFKKRDRQRDPNRWRERKTHRKRDKDIETEEKAQR